MAKDYTFETSELWKRTLAAQRSKDPFAGQRDRLRTAFLQFRQQAELLAGEIARDLPSRTVHDITHLDALWSIADTIIGDEYEVNPAEAFVLGGSFLVHDLAMSRAAYPDGLDSLRQEPAWRDTVALLLKSRLGRTPRRDEIDNAPEDIVARATEEVIVDRHAQQARDLPTTSWSSIENKSHHYLIEVQDVRDTYGPTIGEIAHSHWWSVDDLTARLGEPLGAAVWCPSDWAVNKVKIACILRTADAAHLDARRAPSFLRVLRRPVGSSDDYWKFQEYLLQPRCLKERLEYSAHTRFDVSRSAAWWICFDSLQMVDRELRQVDALLSNPSSGCDRFQARGVRNIENSERLAESIKTTGWIPVDASIRVSDVASLAASIGGRQLYGDDNTIPLRELVQNGVDALRARQLIEDRPKDWGHVKVSLGKDASGDWLEVEDTGIGMSKDVLIGPLVDFGKSYWSSQLMRREHPGLLAKGFQSIGQYGIGFFSVFMVGDRVRITTQRYEKGKQDTLVLEFGSGLSRRPILRQAARQEWLSEGGTRVRVWLKSSPNREGGFLERLSGKKDYIESLCMDLFPALSVNLRLKNYDAAEKQILSADDWITIEPEELRRRLVRNLEAEFHEKDGEDSISMHMRCLEDASGEIVGRAYAGPLRRWRRGEEPGVITVGGIRANRIIGIVGIMVGTSARATRDAAIPVVSPVGLARWATEQAHLAVHFGIPDDQRMELAQLVCACGGDTGQLPIGSCAAGPMTLSEVKEWAKNQMIVMLVHSDNSRPAHKTLKEMISASNALLLKPSASRRIGLEVYLHNNKWPSPDKLGALGFRNIDGYTVAGYVIKALAETWGATVEEVLQASSMEKVLGSSLATQYIDFMVRGKGGGMRSVYVDIIINPNSEH